MTQKIRNISAQNQHIRNGLVGRGLYALAAMVLMTSTVLAGTAERAKTEKMEVPNLKAAGEIIVDQWGLPHIYAQSERDAFFLQGWNAGRDRLWQIDLWRKRGLGRLAASFGPDHAEQDRALRLFLYQGDMNTEWAPYDKGARSAAEAFADGVNAYVARVKADPNLLPVEFRLSGSEPEMWSAEDIVRIRSNGLSRNLTSEVKRAQSACAAGIEADALRKKLLPPTKLTVPDGLDPCSIPQDVLRDFVLATDPVAFSGATKKASLDDPQEYQTRLAELERNIETTGSNNWTISPSRTVSGRPVLSGDPHRYEAMRTVTEEIPVKGEAPRKVDLKFTRHGPVIYTDLKNNKAFALRSVWSEPGSSPYFSSIGFMKAKNWKDFSKAAEGWGAPSLNQAYADTAGNIGWKATGFAPVRANWDGLMPVPGDGRYEWNGLRRGDELPSAYNPKEGYVGKCGSMPGKPRSRQPVRIDQSQGAKHGSRLSEK